jgi:hypothetical protein
MQRLNSGNSYKIVVSKLNQGQTNVGIDVTEVKSR